MKRILFASVLSLSLAAVCWSASSPVAAQEIKQDRPRVEDILDREAEAMGGKEANSKIKTFIMQATVSVDGVDINIVAHYAGPNKTCMEISIDGIGSETTVVNGNMAWVTGDLSGDRILDGDEKAEAFRKAKEMAETYARIGNWRTDYKQVALLGEVDLDGKAAYKVSLTSQKGDVVINYYDKATGLLVQSEAKLDTPEGPVDVVITNGDHKKVDGVTLAFSTTISSAEGDIFVVIDSVQHNVAIPDSLFVLPSDLKNGGGN
ncbi:MAG TPA: hypothetical protein VE988_02510 [Gemmataceae bacterium]|nr:hypothetical protein [Gemmataceae bacterium]